MSKLFNTTNEILANKTFLLVIARTNPMLSEAVCDVMELTEL